MLNKENLKSLSRIRLEGTAHCKLNVSKIFDAAIKQTGLSGKTHRQDIYGILLS